MTKLEMIRLEQELRRAEESGDMVKWNLIAMQLAAVEVEGRSQNEQTRNTN